MSEWDLLDEDCSDISDWTDGDYDTGVSEVDPAGQFRHDTNSGAAGNANTHRYRTLTSPPAKFIIEIKTYFDVIGAIGDVDYFRLQYKTGTWVFKAVFASDGLFIYKTGGASAEIGTDIVKHGGTKAWQEWRFDVDKSGGEAAATVEVFLDDASQGTVDCDYEVAGQDGRIGMSQYGHDTDDMVSHFDFVRVKNKVLSISVHDCGETSDIVVGG